MSYMKKSKNIKIKHRKYSLYNRRKSKGRQALAIILTIVLAAALCVVGYGLGKPIMEYFQNRQNDTGDGGTAWTPPTYETGSGGESYESAAADGETSAPEQDGVQGAYLLPANAAANATSLSAAVNAAKSQGYSAVAVTLKSDTGGFLYKSEIAGIKDSEAVTGTLTAKQIYDTITEAGLEPQARINTLKDHTSPSYVDDIKFVAVEGWGWLDNYADQGGKPWVSAFGSRTPQFVSSVVRELSNAGFKQIVLANTVFPAFRPADYGYLADINDSKKRSDALWSVVSACQEAAGDAKLLIEMDAAELLGTERLSTTAELANDRAKLEETELLLDYTGMVTSGANSYAQARSFIGRMQGAYSGQRYSVVISRSQLSQADLDAVTQAFTESGINVFIK